MNIESTDFVYGINPVLELLKAGKRKARKIFLSRENPSKTVEEILAIAREKEIQTEWKEKKELDKLSPSSNHQGIICLTNPFPLIKLVDSLDKKNNRSTSPDFYIILDSINDPMNFGAIIRSCVIAGVDGIVIPKHGSCPVTATVAKASAGAVEYSSIIMETNLVNAISLMKEKGLWVFGFDEKGHLPYTEIDFSVPIALVFGSEGDGIRPLVKKNCDETVSIPSKADMISLNVSSAVSVVVFEAVRQRAVRLNKVFNPET